MTNRLLQHFAAHRRRGGAAFFWWITLEGLALSALCATLFLFIDAGESARIPPMTHVRLFLIMVVIVPFTETLVLQGVPVALARRLGAGYRGQLLAAWLPFAALHFFNGVASGFSAGLVGGFYLAFAYLHWRQASLRTALVLTSLSHALHNLVAFAGGVLSGGF